MSFAQPSCDVRDPKNVPVVLVRTPPTWGNVISRLKAVVAQVDDGVERMLQGMGNGVCPARKVAPGLR
jgi:hypothetical protein